VLVAVAILLFMWWSRQSATQAATASQALFSGNIEELARLAEQQKGTPTGDWAALSFANYRSIEASRERFQNRSPASEKLKEAIDKYRIATESRLPLVKEEATFGLAKALECRGTADDLKEAREKYQAVIKNWSSGAFAEMAQKRLDDLDRQATMDFYQAFAQFDPKPSSKGPDLSGRPPFSPDSLPENPPGPSLIPNLKDDKSFEFPDLLKTTTKESPKLPDLTVPKLPGPPGLEKSVEKTPAKSPEAKTADKTPEPKTPDKPAEVKTPEKSVEAKTGEVKTGEKPAEAKTPEKSAEKKS
jgi:hypothetical protein